MQKFGKYEVLEEIGQGGFGVVYKGREPFIKRLVAIKTCNSDLADMRVRFFREAEISGNLQHRNITTVYDFGIEAEVPYLVQEFLSGEDLDRLIKRRDAASAAVRLDYLKQVATGLEYAHEQKVIHRDIKPANIRVLEGGAVKIMDFGIAKLAHVESQLTRTGTTLGTAAYLAPEQLSGEKVDPRADMWAYGVLAYELLTFTRPFAAKTISVLFHEILSLDPDRLDVVWPRCPTLLADVVHRCLEKRREDRYANFSEVLQDLERVVVEPTGTLVSAAGDVRAELPDDRTGVVGAASGGVEPATVIVDRSLPDEASSSLGREAAPPHSGQAERVAP